MSIDLRDVREDELPWLAACEHELFGAGAWSADLIDTDWRFGTNRYRVIELDGKACGYAIYGFEGDAFHLMNLAVLPEHRRRGLATAAMAELVAEATRLNAPDVWLEVAVDNPAAIALYEAHGFERVRVRKRYYQPGDIDAIVMRLELRPFNPKPVDAPGA